MTRTINPEVTMTLDEAVKEVLVLLTGQDLTYDSGFDRFRVITRHLNRALRTNALELEWSYYHEILNLGEVQEDDQIFEIVTDYRFRVIGDDAARLVTESGQVVAWAYYLPRDALHKYVNRDGLWCAVTRNQLIFSRPLPDPVETTYIELPVMREPKMFRLPEKPEDAVDTRILAQPIDFDLPDLITARAAWLYAQTDPVMQPRAQTLEEQMNALKYQAMERDTQFTESPYLNEFILPVQADIYGVGTSRPWPVSNRR